MRYVVIFVMLVLPVLVLGECPHERYTIIGAEKYRDGGTICASVTDSAGCLVECRYDGKIGSPTRGCIYIITRQTGFQEDRLASSVEEARILHLISAVLDSSMSRIQQKKYSGGDFEEMRERVRYGAFFLQELLEKCGWR